MKKLFVLVLALCILLCSCRKTDADEGEVSGENEEKIFFSELIEMPLARVFMFESCEEDTGKALLYQLCGDEKDPNCAEINIYTVNNDIKALLNGEGATVYEKESASVKMPDMQILMARVRNLDGKTEHTTPESLVPETAGDGEKVTYLICQYKGESTFGPTYVYGGKNFTYGEDDESGALWLMRRIIEERGSGKQIVEQIPLE